MCFLFAFGNRRWLHCMGYGGLLRGGMRIRWVRRTYPRGFCGIKEPLVLQFWTCSCGVLPAPVLPLHPLLAAHPQPRTSEAIMLGTAELWRPLLHEDGGPMLVSLLSVHCTAFYGLRLRACSCFNDQTLFHCRRAVGKGCSNGPIDPSDGSLVPYVFQRTTRLGHQWSNCHSSRGSQPPAAVR